MDGIRANGVSLFLGKLPGRKRECFYFMEGNEITPVAFVSAKHEAEAKRLWAKMFDFQERVVGATGCNCE